MKGQNQMRMQRTKAKGDHRNSPRKALEQMMEDREIKVIDSPKMPEAQSSKAENAVRMPQSKENSRPRNNFGGLFR
jgi:hypothetical protein